MKNLISWPWSKKEEQNNSPAQNLNQWLEKAWFTPMPYFGSGWLGSYKLEYPTLDVVENDKEVVVKAEIPGMNEKDIHIEYENGTLTLRGEKKEAREDKDSKLKENWYGSFSRCIYLGEALKFDDASAKYKKGALTIFIPKDAKLTAKKEIEII